MLDIEYGFRRAVREMIVGFFLSNLLTIIKSMPLDQTVVRLFEIFITLFSILLVLKMRYWGNGYLVGWLLGLIVMAYFHLLSFISFDSLIFLVIPLVILVVRKFRSFD